MARAKRENRSLSRGAGSFLAGGGERRGICAGRKEKGFKSQVQSISIPLFPLQEQQEQPLEQPLRRIPFTLTSVPFGTETVVWAFQRA
jgi:hypothetical protein